MSLTSFPYLLFYLCDLRYASTFGIPILSGGWIGAAWEKRHEIGFRADSKDFLIQVRIMRIRKHSLIQ